MAISMVNLKAPEPELDLRATAERIADEIAAPAAASVDREARFPNETLSALASAGLLGMLVPRELGGMGRRISDAALVSELIARRCASAGMVFAMHQIQVACLAWHAASQPWFERQLGRLVREQRLIASVTSEVGVGGDLRSSIACVERDGERARLEKRAPTVSYGLQADDLLISARREASSAPGDQVLVLVARSDCELEPASSWNTLGMRGTCSPGFVVRASFGADQIVSQPFGEIAAQTMVPVSHLLWSAVWLGIATAALAKAHRFVRGQARSSPGNVPPGALRLAEASNVLETMRARHESALGEYERLRELPDAAERLSSLAYATKLNGLKLAASEMVVQVVGGALGILGMAGYREEGELSVARHLRDAHSAALMINNDRIYAANASLLLVQKELA